MGRFCCYTNNMSAPTDLLELRRRRLERTGVYPIHTQEEALAFLDDIGFCRFSYHADCELPSFSGALAAEVSGELWAWKDALPNTRRVYYGALFRFSAGDSVRPGFLSLTVLAALYSLSNVCQFGGGRDLLPRWAGVSREAVGLADALEHAGPLSTAGLRAAAGLQGKEHAALFHKALIEAQRQFLIVRTGVTSVTRANYGYVWSSFASAYPDVIRQAEALDDLAAAAALVDQYVDAAVQVSLERIAFVLSLNLRLLRRAAAQLAADGRLEELPGEPPLFTKPG